MNILIVVDKVGSAIHRLAKSVEKHNEHLDITVFPVHPKRNDVDTLIEVQKLMKKADFIDIHYWRSGEVLRTSFPKEFEKKPKLLCHFNPYDYDKLDWQEYYDEVVVGNDHIHSKIPYAHLIPYAIDLDFFEWNEDYTQDKRVQMVVGRIEGKKGVLPVAKACEQLGYEFELVGRVSKTNYMREIFKHNVKFKENATEDELLDSYHNVAVHVCNSVDGFESGTLPILESMSTGVPVLTRPVGHVPDIYNGKNMVVRSGQPEDLEDLKKHLKELVENRDWRLKLREKGWQTVKNGNDKKMARRFSDLYYHIMSKKPTVSVVIPTYNRGESLIDTLAHVESQTYKQIEVVVVDSGDESAEGVVEAFREQTSKPVRYIRFDSKGEYTLPKARNVGVMESQGRLLVFCDDRIAMENKAVEKFVENHGPRMWLWGEKDGTIKGFVENFSCVARSDLITGGMFSERIDEYGGATQEIRERFESRQGFNFVLVEEAKANSNAKSSSKWKKRKQIINSKYKLFKLYG